MNKKKEANSIPRKKVLPALICRICSAEGLGSLHTHLSVALLSDFEKLKSILLLVESFKKNKVLKLVRMFGMHSRWPHQ